MNDKLLILAEQFRAALEKVRNDATLPGHFKDFPRGTCGDTSDILSKFLESHGIDNIEYVCGVFRDGKSHAWLEVAGYIIDITADQFPDVFQRVIVSKESLWHDEFEERQRRKAGYIVRNQITHNLDKVYRAALAKI
jgi:hypothetical protein